MDHFTPIYLMNASCQEAGKATGNAENVSSRETREVRTRGRWFLAGSWWEGVIRKSRMQQSRNQICLVLIGISPMKHSCNSLILGTDPHIFEVWVRGRGSKSTQKSNTWATLVFTKKR